MITEDTIIICRKSSRVIDITNTAQEIFWITDGQYFQEDLKARLHAVVRKANKLIKDANELIAIINGEEDRAAEAEVSNPKPASEPTKAPDKCTCGDCHYFHGPTGFNRYGKEIGECYAQKDAPTVEKNEESCADFDWKGDMA